MSSGQSLDVDAVSGAAPTSDTVLKAIENALE
ncbi:FMN-binding protein [Faecalispora anaeroviscerum]